jgi:hypothetical protein
MIDLPTIFESPLGRRLKVAIERLIYGTSRATDVPHQSRVFHPLWLCLSFA